MLQNGSEAWPWVTTSMSMFDRAPPAAAPLAAAAAEGDAVLEPQPATIAAPAMTTPAIRRTRLMAMFSPLLREKSLGTTDGRPCHRRRRAPFGELRMSR